MKIHILTVKIDFSLVLTQNIMKIKTKRFGIFSMLRKWSKCRNPRWPPAYIKKNIFTNNFATTYARDINNMYILMFSGMRKPIIAFVFGKKSYSYVNISENNWISL